MGMTARKYRNVDLHAIQFGSVWNETIDPNSTRISSRALAATEKEIRQALRASNCVTSSRVEDLPESPVKKRQRLSNSPTKAPRVTPKTTASQAIPADLLLPTNAQLQRPRIHETNSEIKAVPSSLRLKVLKRLCDNSALKELAAIEYGLFLVYAHDNDTHKKMVDDFAAAKYPLIRRVLNF